MAVFFAAACGVPTELVSGDTATCKEAIDLLGHVETASTVTVEIDMVNPKMIPWWTAVPTVEATGPCGIRFQAEDYCAAHRLFVMMDKLHSAFHREAGVIL